VFGRRGDQQVEHAHQIVAHGQHQVDVQIQQCPGCGCGGVGWQRLSCDLSAVLGLLSRWVLLDELALLLAGGMLLAALLSRAFLDV
jgi:hypothetical protein